MDKLTVPTEGTYYYKDYTHAGSVIEINSEENKAAITRIFREIMINFHC